MAMTPAGRAQAIYDKIAAGPNFDKLSAGEKAALKAQIQSIWGDGDLVYIQANAEADPGTFEIATGQCLVSTTGSPTAQTGANSVPAPLSGKGTIS